MNYSPLKRRKTHRHASFSFSLEGGGAVSLASAAVSLCVCSAHKPFPVSACQANQMTEPARLRLNVFLDTIKSSLICAETFFFFFRCSGFHSWCNKRVTGQMLFIYLEMICVCQWALRKEDLSLIRKLEDVLGHFHAALLYIMQTQGLSVFHPHCWSNYWWLNSLGYVFAGIVHSELWTIQLLTKMHLMSNTKLQTQASTSSHEQSPDMYLVHYRCRAECGQLFHTHKRSKNSSN